MFNNYYELKIEGKDVKRFIKQLYNLGIYFEEIKFIDKIVYVKIDSNNYKKLSKVKTIYKIYITNLYGINKIKDIIKKYNIFFICILLGIVLLNILCNITFEIEIDTKNEEIYNLVERQLKVNGIKKYTFMKDFKKRQVIINNILENNKDKLEWLEIERVGTKYVVKLEERKINSISSNYKNQDIVSTHDAVIKKIIAKSGVKVKEVNEYVKKGDTVISGTIYLNEEIKEITKALGEIYGEVWYKISVEYPIIKEYEFETGNKKEVISVNFFNKNFIIFNNNPYKSTKVKRKYILKNNILPISISKDTIYELKSYSGIYVEGEAVINAKDYARRKIEETLKNDEYIISEKVLKYSTNSNTIYIDMFYKIYKNITGTKEIIIEEGE